MLARRTYRSLRAGPPPLRSDRNSRPELYFAASSSRPNQLWFYQQGDHEITTAWCFTQHKSQKLPSLKVDVEYKVDSDHSTPEVVVPVLAKQVFGRFMGVAWVAQWIATKSSRFLLTNFTLLTKRPQSFRSLFPTLSRPLMPSFLASLWAHLFSALLCPVTLFANS